MKKKNLMTVRRETTRTSIAQERAELYIGMKVPFLLQFSLQNVKLNKDELELKLAKVQ